MMWLLGGVWVCGATSSTPRTTRSVGCLLLGDVSIYYIYVGWGGGGLACLLGFCVNLYIYNMYICGWVGGWVGG